MPRVKGKSIAPTESQLAALKPYQWRPGQTGNGGGRPRTHRQAVLKLRENTDFFIDQMLAIAAKYASGEPLTISDKIASQHFEMIWRCCYGSYKTPVLADGADIGDDEPGSLEGMSALLRAVRSAAH